MCACVQVLAGRAHGSEHTYMCVYQSLNMCVYGSLHNCSDICVMVCVMVCESLRMCARMQVLAEHKAAYAAATPLR